MDFSANVFMDFRGNTNWKTTEIGLDGNNLPTEFYFDVSIDFQEAFQQ